MLRRPRPSDSESFRIIKNVKLTFLICGIISKEPIYSERGWSHSCYDWQDKDISCFGWATRKKGRYKDEETKGQEFCFKLCSRWLGPTSIRQGKLSASSSQAVGSPQPSLSNKLMSDTSPSSMLPKVLTRKKRKLEEMVRNNDLEDFQAEEESATSNWEHVEESYSRLNTERGVKFRCDLCFNNNVKKVLR